jgi:hypothetical protein
MMNELLNAIFFKKSNVPAVEHSVPVFKITQNAPIKNDFEVTELSYAEYMQFIRNERQNQNGVLHS